jgi:hypothetical protein
MIDNGLQRKLINAARKHPPGDQVPYAFERRIMARLRDSAHVDRSLLWAQSLWRATAPCIAIMLFLAAWSAFDPVGDTSGNLPQELDNTILAAAETDNAPDSGW